MANSLLVPVVYHGPLTFKGLLKRQPLEVLFGDPIYIPRKEKVNKETTPALYQQLEDHVDKLDKEQNLVFIILQNNFLLFKIFSVRIT